MTTLLTYTGTAEPDSPATRTGGLPLVPPGTTWPTCATCDGPLQHLARLRLSDDPARAGDPRVAHVFMCDNDPGMCECWEAGSGANAVLVVPADGAVLEAPADGVTELGETSAVELTPFEGTYDEAREAWAQRPEGRRVVLGQLGGEPGWVQGDEGPDCPVCAAPMAFLAQLEEGRNRRTGANFGGGSAYVFACTTHDEGRFLWQQ